MTARTPLLPLAICAAIMLLDGIDLAAMPLALPHVAAEWSVAPERLGFVLSAVLIGLGAGAFLLAPYGDKYGRRVMIVSGLGLLAVSTLGTALSGSITALFVWRFATGLGLGICLPNVTAMTAEIAPRHFRAGAMTAISCAVPVGGLLAGLIAPVLVERWGWHSLFVGPAILTGLLVLAALLWLPSSQHAQDAPPVTRAPMLAPLTRPYWRASAVFIGLYTTNALVLYLLSSWLPAILPDVGFTLADAARLTAFTQAGGLIGGLGLAFFLDRGKTVATLLAAYAAAIAALVAIGFVAPQFWVWAAAMVVVGLGSSGTHLALMAVGASFYPPAMLSTAIGLAVAVARVGAVAGPLVGAALLGWGFDVQQFLLAATVPLALCALGVLLVPTVRKPAEP
ncbi:MFS transporter [Aurantiacibacter xanthus]|uniref:MFS transporter n=1 Tax=Aurantiacibacter xanthus TaxID=1784712 RepID=UPI0011C218E7|nr:MFS transporter [Aurantiacibacter xanthus]